MFVNMTFLPQPSYATTISRVLNAEIERISFVQNVEAAERINSYVAEKTHNLITEVIEPNSLNEGITMVLVNVIYFKGEWLYTFNKSRTFTGSFNVDDKSTVPVDYMTIKTRFLNGYIPELQSFVVSLPYKNSDMTMLLVLPRNKTGLPHVVNKMSDFDWSAIDQKMMMGNINVTMPKFNITFESHIDGILRNVSKN